MFRSALLRVAKSSGSRMTYAPRALAVAQRWQPIRFYSEGPPPLTTESVTERIVGVLQGFDKVPENAQITADTSFSKDLKLDSLDVVDVLFQVEEEFSIHMGDDDADAITTVGEAVKYILEQKDAL